ncbi:MAG: sulfatase-like hydrolase/transferase [Candidatus Altiarchaeota archaeon]
MIKTGRIILIAAIMYIITIGAYFTITSWKSVDTQHQGEGVKTGETRDNEEKSSGYWLEEDNEYRDGLLWCKGCNDIDGMPDGQPEDYVGHDIQPADANETPEKSGYGTDDYRQGLDLSCRGCNVLFINIDLLRADYIGLLNPAGNHTPNIDRFFEKSVIFEQAQAPAGQTYTSNTAVLTSQEAFGIPDLTYKDEYTPSESIAEVLVKQGYSTINVNEGDSTGKEANMEKGFTDQTEVEGYVLMNDSVGILLEKIGSAREEDRPFFILFHEMEMHYPYVYPMRYWEHFDSLAYEDPFINVFIQTKNKNPWRMTLTYEIPITYQTRVIGGPYEKTEENDALYTVWEMPGKEKNVTYSNRETIRELYGHRLGYVDSELKPLFTLLDNEFLNNTIIVFYSNHGEALTDKKNFEHGISYKSCIHVPLMILHPRVERQVRIKDPVSLVDLTPTIYDMLGIKPVEGASGTSLTPLIKNGSYDREFIYGKSYKGDYIRRGDWKLIVFKSRYKELYDLHADPEEEHNVINQHPAIESMLEAQLIREKLKADINEDWEAVRPNNPY